MSDERSAHLPTAPQMEIPGSERSDGEANVDFAIAEEVCAAAEASGLTIATAPIHNVNNLDFILYRECFPWLLGSRGEPLSPAIFVPSLERTGMIRWVDRYVVRRVIRALRDRHYLVLWVNILALSAVDDALCTATLIDLQESPDFAQRLVLEISENASVKLGPALRFGNMLRQLGRVIAIDDFGVAYGVETSIAIVHSDIIKIDALFLSRIKAGTNIQSRLEGMIRIASNMSPKVVVEGIESKAAIEHIRDAVSLWVYGRCFERQSPYLV
ncbi:EAL domain-containing protein [Burkholderia ubonensis]|uniref:EAL domain-containing protein n=1 Tax=Burkholderia ubonensis TaxID=101571 RepID=UPI0012FA12EE|nr:EAL domain-containing protein [Burkholderia ubonensis]